MRRSRVRTKRVILLTGAALIMVILAFFAVDAVLAVQQLQRGAARLQKANEVLGQAPAGWTPDRVAAASALLRDARREIDGASARLHSNPVVQGTALLPSLGDQTEAALDLADSASEGVSAAEDFIQIIDRYQDAGASGGAPGPRYVAFMSAAAPAFVDAQQHLDRALSRLHRDLRHPLLTPLDRQVRAAIQRLQPARDNAAAAALLGRYLPDAAGEHGNRTYLLLFTNPAELRPAGGFVGSVGVITIDHGTPSTIEVRGEEDFDGRYRTRFPVPAALGARLSFPNNSLDIGDAGWDPDYPSSAALSEQMFQSATGRTVDGTITIDPYAISALLRITGPVDVPSYGVFTADNFFSRVDQIVNVEKGPFAGKKALRAISQAVAQHFFAAPVDRWPQMLATSKDAARGGHIQFFLHDRSMANAVGAAQLDGSVVNPPDGQDYLMVVDANVGGTKGDGYVSKAMEDRVEVRPGNVIRHEVILRYTYPAGHVDPTVGKGADTAYRDFVRLYLPETSTLTGFYQVDDGGSKGGAVQEISAQHGKRVIGTFFRLESGRSIELHFAFQGPADSTPSYRLYVQKQAGILARPLHLLVSYPGGLARRQMAGDRDGEVLISW